MSNDVAVVYAFILQLWRADTFGYYDISNIFTPELKGMRGQGALCPLPTTCELP